MEDQKIKVDGLATVVRALKRVDAEAPKQLRITLNKTADQLVDATRPQIPAVTGRARGSLVAQSTRSSARIAVGGKRAPWYPWLDFGGQGRRAGRPGHRPFVAGGRYLYPTLGRIRPQIERSLEEGIRDVARKAGLVVD